MTETTPDPAREWAEAWLEDHPDARPADVHRAVGVVYGKDEADRVVAAVFRKPSTVADIPAGQGPASLFIKPNAWGDPSVWFRHTADATPRYMLSRSLVDPALWDHLAATLPTVTTEEGP